MNRENLGKGMLLLVIVLILGGVLLFALWQGATPSAAQDGDGADVPPTLIIPEYVVGTHLAGKTIHWTTYQTIFVRDGPDPANGKTTIEESWVEVGRDNIPTRAHIVSRFEDGSFRQEVLITPNDTTVIFGAGYPTVAPDGTNNCRQTWAPYTPEQRSGLLPTFLDPDKLSAAGWKNATIDIPAFPVPTLQVGALPEDTIEIAKSSGWTSETAQDDMLITGKVLLGELGQVVVSTSTRTDRDGTLAAESQWVNGPIEVYATNPSLDKAFELTSQASEVCHA